jgi:hypothetical protein
VLERVARGAGQTRWFFCRTMADVMSVLPRLRPGSRVGFFFDDLIRREPFSDRVEEELWDLVASTGEAVFGTEQPDDSELTVHLLDASDFSQYVAGVREGQAVYYGPFPFIEDDGVSSVMFTPPDHDGVVRPQPT